MIRAIGIQAVALAFNAAVSLALVVFLGRQLGTEGFGHYAAFLSLATVVLVAIEGGWPTLVYRDGIDAPSAARARTGLALGHMLVSGGAFVLIVLLAGGGWGAAMATALACMTMVAGANLVSARLRAQGRFATDAGWQACVRVITAVAIVSSVLGGLQHPTAIFCAWGAGVLLALLAWGRRELVPPRLAGLANGYRAAAAFVVVEILTAALLRGDVALYAALGIEPQPLSRIAAATRYFEFTILMFAPVGNVMLHRLRGASSQPVEFARSWRLTAGAAAGCGLLALAIAAAARDPLMRLAFGDEFAIGAAVLPLVMAALPIALANLVLAAALIAVGRERRLGLNLALATLAMAIAAVIASGLHEARFVVLSTAIGQALLLAANLHALRGTHATPEAMCASR